MSRVSYVLRAQRHPAPRHAVAVRFFNTMARKESNLIVAADVDTTEALLTLADTLGPYMCALKMHLDLLTDYDVALPRKLVALAKKHDFLLFEDRKFADIGGITRRQWAGGLYRLAEWVDVVTVHSLPGPGTLDAIASSEEHRTALFLIPQLSSKGALTTEAYRSGTERMLRACYKRYPAKVCGVITQCRSNPNDIFVYAMPGVRLAPAPLTGGGNNLNIRFGQQYKTPCDAIVRDGADAIIVGSGILQASDRVAAAKRYQQAGWQAYLARLDEILLPE